MTNEFLTDETNEIIGHHLKFRIATIHGIEIACAILPAAPIWAMVWLR